MQYSIAKRKYYADWAIARIGHWCAGNTFIHNNKKIRNYYFDLDYDYNANKNYQMFMNRHYESGLSKDNHPCTVKDCDGWYVYAPITEGLNEVSFSKGVYIIGVASYTEALLTEQELISFAEALQIWDRDEK